MFATPPQPCLRNKILVWLVLHVPLLILLQSQETAAQNATKIKQRIDFARSLYDSNPDSTVGLMEQLLSSTKGNPNPEIQALEAEMRKTLSTALSLVGQTTRALKEGKKAVKLYAEQTDSIGMGVAHANLGMIYFGLALYTEAANEYGNALFYMKDRGKDAAMAGINNNLGNLLMVQNKFQEARTQYESALSTYRKLNIPSGVSYTINNIGVIHEKQKKYAAAIDCYLQALRIDEQENDMWGQVNGNLNLGDVFALTGRHQQAEERYRTGLAMAEKISDIPSIIRALLALARRDLDQGQHNRAQSNAQRALELAEKSGSKQNIDNLYTLLTDISMAMNRPQKALDYQKEQLANLNETHLQEMKLAQQNAMEQTEVRLIDALDQNEVLKSDLNSQKTNFKYAIRMNLVLGAGLLMMLLFLGRFVRQHRKQQQVQLGERNRREQEQEARQRQKLHDTQEELFHEQRMQAQNISMFLKEISQQLGILSRVKNKVNAASDQSPNKTTCMHTEQLKAHIDDLMLLINIQHHPRDYPPTQNTAEELITQSLQGIGVDFQLTSQRSGLLMRTHPALFYLMMRNLVEWMEEPYRQSGRPLKPVQVDLKEPKQRLLPIQLKWVDYGPELLDSAQQAVLQLSNRRFDWPISIAGRATLGGLAIVHQSIQQLGGQVTMDLPKGVPGLTLQVLMPLQD